MLVETMTRTEINVIKRIIEKVDESHMFWLRVDLGMYYLEQKYGYDKASRIWLKPEFWTWWRWVWHDNDLSILDWCIQPEDRLTWGEYAQTQYAKATKIQMDAKLLSILTKNS